MNRLLSIALFAAAAGHATAQKGADAPQPKPAVKDVCMLLETRIVHSYKAYEELSASIPKAKTKEEVVEIVGTQAAYTRGKIEAEESWARLGCTQILYGANKK